MHQQHVNYHDKSLVGAPRNMTVLCNNIQYYISGMKFPSFCSEIVLVS